MNCTKCGSATRCIDSRPTHDNVRRRRYVCDRCEHRFNTLELAIPDDHDFARTRILHESVIKARLSRIFKAVSDDILQLFDTP